MSGVIRATSELEVLEQAWAQTSVAWCLGADERDALLGGRNVELVQRTAETTQRSQRRMQLVVRVHVLSRRVFPDDGAAREWLRAPRGATAGMTPLEAMSHSPEWIGLIIQSMEMVS